MKQSILYLLGHQKMGVLMPYSRKGKSKMSNLNHAEEVQQNHLVECFCDSDWSGDKTTRCSTSSVVIFLDSIPIHSHCRGQKGVSLSSCEAEILALTSGGAEAIQVGISCVCKDRFGTSQ